MKSIVLLLIISLSVYIKFGQAEEDYFASFLIKSVIEAALNQAIKTGYFTLVRKFSLTIPEKLNKVIVGRIGIKNATVYGLSTMDYDDTVDVDKEVENNVTITTYNVAVNATLEKLGFHTTYEADLGLVDTVPIYGKGEIQIEIKQVDIKVNVTLNDRKRLNIQKLELELSFGTSNESYISGFWNNVRVSRFLTKAMNIIERFFSMYYNYSKKCLECVIAKLIQFVGNLIMIGKSVRYVRCSCCKENEEIKHLQSILESLPNKNIAEILNEEIGDPENVKKLITLLKNILQDILKYRNNLVVLLPKKSV